MQSVHTKAPELAEQPLRCVPATQPGPHVAHASDPALLLYVPAAHPAQLPGARPPHSIRYSPGAQPPQSTQVPSELPPQPRRYVPAGHWGASAQGAHSSEPEPDLVLYFPDSQATQLPAELPSQPMRCSPGGQAAHVSQVPGPPPGHLQAPSLVQDEQTPAAGPGPPQPLRTFPEGQASQSAQEEAPVAVWYVCNDRASLWYHHRAPPGASTL